MKSFFLKSTQGKLLEKMMGHENLRQACLKVMTNHGAPGIDLMPTSALLHWLNSNETLLCQAVLDKLRKAEEAR